MKTKQEMYEDDVRYAEREFPGITKYDCYDPYTDYIIDSLKCKNCPRNRSCKMELEQISKAMDNFGNRKKKSSKPKPKRKVKKCRCK